MPGIPYEKIPYLRILRGNGLTQAEIAHILGVSQQVVSYTLQSLRKAYFRQFPGDKL